MMRKFSMRNYKVILYTDKKQNCEIKKFIDSHGKKEIAKIDAWISQLEVEGPQLPRPYADLLKDGIHELRVSLPGKNVRILYFFSFGSFIIITHGFVKTTKKVPEYEIKKAIKIRGEFLKRFNTQKHLEEYLK